MPRPSSRTSVRRHRQRLGRSKVAGTFKGSLLAGYHLLLTTVRYAWRR